MLGDLDHTDFLASSMLLRAEDLDRQKLLDDWYGQLAQIAAVIAGHRASLKAKKEKLERGLRAMWKTVDAAMVYAEAEKAAQIEATASRDTRPILSQLAEISAHSANQDDKVNRAIRRYAEETIDIGVTWLELIQNYRISCLRIASDKGGERSVISSSDELEQELASLTEDAGTP